MVKIMEDILVGGLDIGTSGCKIALYDAEGRFVRDEYCEYDVSRKGGLHEIDVCAVYDSVKKVIKAADCKNAAAIAVTSFGETFAMLDKNDEPCAPSMLYTDTRGKEQCERLISKFGAEKLAFKTGAKTHEMYSLPKLMWVKENMPENFARAEKILLMQDYIVYMLCSIRQIDFSLAARTICFDIENKCWDREILVFAGIDEKLLSKPVPTGTAAGKIKPALAAELGVSANCVIVSGAHDQIAAMCGADIRTNEQVMDGTGTVECVPVLFDEVPEDFAFFDMGYSLAPHPNGGFACYVLSYTGGATLKWFRDNFSDVDYAELDKTVGKEPSDLMIMPHFAGAATPYMDSNSRAAILGLTFEHTKADIYKALMEGTAYEIALNFEILKKRGLSAKSVTATGGGARSDVWLQIKADVLGLPVTALDGREIGGAGTAVMAGRAVGMYDGSTLPDEINFADTAIAVELAQGTGASVEAEIGSMGARESGTYGGESIYTTPEAAKRFSEETGIDALACAFGTAHGIYLKEPKLDFARLDEINKITNVPIVMHGGSGVSHEDYKSVIKLGVRKINYYTYMAKAGGDAVSGKTYGQFHDAANDAIAAMRVDVKKAMRVFCGE